MKRPNVKQVVLEKAGKMIKLSDEKQIAYYKSMKWKEVESVTPEPTEAAEPGGC